MGRRGAHCYKSRVPDQPLRDPRSEFSIDPRQREIRELLELIGPEPATYFSDACRIMDGAAGVGAQTHLTAHLLREVEGRLHELIEPMLSADAKQRISDAGRDRASHRARITEAAAILELDDPATEQWIEYALPLHTFAHRYSLAGARDVAEFRERFANGQSVLLAVLRALRGVYVNARPVLVELAGEQHPTEEHLRLLRRRVPHSSVALGEFFSLATLGWFPLLRDAGYFGSPPPMEVDEEGRLSYIEWPPARFLVRAAAVAELQPEVVEILNVLDTNNPEARDATVEAAPAMPPAVAAQLAARIAAHEAEAEGWWVPRHSEELVDHLLAGGETAAALEVTKPLLVDAPRSSDWRMRHAFTDLLPKLFPAVGLDGLTVLRDLLAEDLTADGRVGHNDHSTIWRESVAGGHDFQRRDLLVTALNAAAEALVENEPALLPEIVAVLVGDERAIFSRLALHLISRHPDPELAAEWLGREDVFRDYNLTREYAELAEQSFVGLPTELKERIFGWIEAGPTWRPQDLPADEVEYYDHGWRLQKLRALPELPNGWRRRYDELVARLGEPEPPLAGPRYLREAIALPGFPRLGDSFNEIDLMVQVPTNVSAYDGQGQLELFRRGIRQVLRYQQFRDFERFVDSLGGRKDSEANGVTAAPRRRPSLNPVRASCAAVYLVVLRRVPARRRSVTAVDPGVRIVVTSGSAAPQRALTGIAQIFSVRGRVSAPA